MFRAILYTMTSMLMTFTGAQFVAPDLGENAPKLSLDCYVEFAKYGKPLIDMLMKANGTGGESSSGNGTKTRQQKLMGLLASPVGTMLDSWGKVPPRVLNLHTNWMGSYDECVSMNFTKYCSTNMKVYNALDGVYGSCIPKDCTDDDAHKLLSFISKNFLNEFITFPGSGSVSNIFGTPTYCEKPVEYKNGFNVTLVLSSIILALCLLGSFVDGFVEPAKIIQTEYYTNSGLDNPTLDTDEEGTDNPDSSTGAKEIPMEKLGQQGQDDENMNNNEKQNLEQSGDSIEKPPKKPETITVEVDADPLLLKIMRCFSLQRNARAVMKTEQPKSAITSVHGIRAISMFWIILCHLYLWSQSIPNDNTIVAMAKLATEWSFEPIVNSFVSVDSFFLLSGLLMSYLSWKKLDKTNGRFNLPMFYLHRFLRLTPLYMFVILFWNNIFPYTVFGPLARRYQTDNHFKACNKYWWSNLLYINNFWPVVFTDGCLDWSWYLANDMQFYIVSPAILFAMYRVEAKFKHSKYRTVMVSAVIAALCTVCVAINAIMIGSYDYPSLLLNGNIPGNPRQASFNKNHSKIYTKPYTRINPYLIGMLAGYFLARKDQIKQTFVYVILWIVAFGLGYAVVYGPYLEAYEELSAYLSGGSNIMYGTFHRLVWGMAVAWVVYACHNGYGGYINSFLSWGAWVPISKLTFAAYLVHPLVIFFFYGSSERPFHYQNNLMPYHVFSNLFWAYGCAFILAITVEYPAMNLEKLLMSSK